MPESRDEAARAAGWRPHPEMTREATASQWARPQLHLRVWAIHDLVRTLAYVEWMGDDGRLVVHEVVRATWKPAEVTEALVVAWGYRALGKWLSDHGGGLE